YPSGSMMKPEPSPITSRGRAFGPPNWRKKNSKGDPGGISGGRSAVAPALGWWTEEMLTTAGVTFSAKGAKLSGAGAANATGAIGPVAKRTSARAAAGAVKRFE